MKRKIIIPSILIGLIILVIIISSCNNLANNDKLNFEKAVNSHDETYCNDVRSRYDPDYKDALFSDYTRENCFIQLAKIKDDVNICHNIAEKDIEQLKFNDINLCIRLFALDKNDKNICSQMLGDDDGGFMSTCISELAIKLKDPILCYEANKDWISSCTEESYPETVDIDLCEHIEQSITDQAFVDGCFIRLARQTKNTGFCQRISEHKIEGCIMEISGKK